MRIAYIVTRSDLIGGAQVHVRDLAASLNQQGHEAVVLTSGSGPYVETLRAAGVETVPLKHLGAAIHPFQDARALFEIHSTLKRLQPDLLSAHSSKAGILGRAAGRLLGLPVIFTAHGWAFTPGIPRREATLYRWIERLAAPLATRIITVSEFDRQLALSHGLASPEKVVTVHNGMPDIPPGQRADPGRSPVRLVMTARFEPQKDHQTLFSALAGLRDQEWQLDLIGDGPLLPDAEAMVRDLGMVQRVRFWGQRMDVAQRLAEAQVAVLITNWEGFPRSILEAMRAGLPVVSSGVGGIGESVRDGETGFVVAHRDIHGLRRRLKQLLDDRDLRIRMGASGRNRYQQHFTLDRTVEKTLSVYREIAASSGRSGLNGSGPVAKAKRL
ncbi:MAG TPA: glycosyltransferase family 4 protein [Gemmatimonadales bacterium]|nr:glycosyltransferase family 4 protein [Gemmatimonadales bacterium]